MFSYIMLGTNDLLGAIRFYNPLMEWLTSSLTGNKCCQHYLLKFPPASHFFLSGFSIIKTVVIIHPVNTFQLSPRL